jgi:Ca-activated chloride channel homolog
MTRLTIETWWPLIFLAVIPFVWRVQRSTVVDLSARHLRLSTFVRVAIVLLLVFALMQPILYRSGGYVSVLYLLDESQSVAPAEIQRALEWIRSTNDAGKPSNARFEPFASNSIVFDKLDEMKHVPVSMQSTPGSVDKSRTDIASAIDRAIHSFAPNHLKRIVLVSDGNDNSGNLAAVLPRLKLDNVHVYTVPLDARANRDVWVEAVMAPSNITADEQFPLEAHVYSQLETPADIEIKDGDKVLATRSVQLKKGLNRVAFETSVKGETRTAVLEANAKVAGEQFTENNVFRESAAVVGRPRVLYVEGYAPSARYLRQALDTEGFLVDAIGPQALPADLRALDAYDAVIVSDVDRKALSSAQMQTIVSYVRDLGGGFILTGGENSYGEGGYSKSPVEEVLPVTFDTKKNEPRSVGMVVVLDRSGSMAGQKMELAKEATKAALDLLRDDDHFGVVAFEYNFKWVSAVQPVAKRAEIKEAISSIQAVGETNIYPALKDAYLKLAETKDDVKHVILLSDGQTFPEDFQGLAEKMAAEKVTVSTIAVGTVADRELLANIAKWGKGRTYYLEDATKVPQVFSQETEMAKSLKEDEPFRPIVKKTVYAFKGLDLKAAPQLLGYVGTKGKPTAEILLETSAHDPLLARWQYGLGKAVAFTSDVKDRWAVQWLRWDGYSKFWSQLVRETMRRQENSEFDFRVTRDGEDAVVSINAIQKDGRFRNKLQTQVRVIAPDQSVSVIDVPQIGPGSYEARTPLKQKGPYIFRAVGEDAGSPARMLTYSYPDEYHFYPANLEKLRAISAETGGVFQPKGPEIFDSNGETTSIPLPLWPWLTAMALVLYIGDVLLRRVRLFEK